MIWQMLILFLTALFGGIGIFFFKNDASPIRLMLVFSGAYLFSITILHLIPEIYHIDHHGPGLFILLGFFFQILLEQFSGGIAHGHVNQQLHQEHTFAISTSMLFCLCLHAFLEGLALTNRHQNKLLVGIVLHHIPAAFALGSILVSHHIRQGRVALLISLFALMAPGGLLLGHFLNITNCCNLRQGYHYVMGIVIGMLLHTSTTILFESSIGHHRFTIKKTMLVLLGIGLAMVGFLL